MRDTTLGFDSSPWDNGTRLRAGLPIEGRRRWVPRSQSPAGSLDMKLEDDPPTVTMATVIPGYDRLK